MTNGGSLHPRKVKLLCNLIHALSSQPRSKNVPVSLFPSVQPVALVGGEGLLKCRGPGGGFTTPLLSVYHTGPRLLTEEHTFLSLLLSLCVCL